MRNERTEQAIEKASKEAGKRRVRFSLCLSPELNALLRTAAEKAGLSVNAYINVVLASCL